VRQAVICGGVKQNPQARAVRAGADVLVATPGRLLDFLAQGLVDISAVEVLVLDEADRMLDMGFIPDIRRILAKLPAHRQTLLFSATMPPPIRKLAEDILHDPLPVAVSPVSSAPKSVAHSVYHVEKPEKPKALTRFLSNTPYSRALVFTRTKHGADRLTKFLVQAGVRAVAIHGNKTQGARTRALAEFRSAKAPVLVATDVAARGLDVDDISHVINYDLTHEPETYVHRIGRTGRAGAVGTAVSFCTFEEREYLRGIERLLGEPLDRANEPTARPVSSAPPRRSTPQSRRPVSRNSRSGGQRHWRSERTHAGR
jgi:ATP-dependent RNA helicase RhlE